MYQTIKNHLKICIGMKRNCMDWKLLELYQEQELLEFLNEVSSINMGEQVQKLQSETVGKLIRDVGFCQILQWLTQEGIELKRIQCFLKKFPGDNPSSCEYAAFYAVPSGTGTKGKPLAGTACFYEHASGRAPV